MTHADIVRVFTYTPTTSEQDEDLTELHTAAQALAATIYKVVGPQAAQQAIQQLTGVISMCRMSIELDPRQAEKKIRLAMV